MSMYDYSFFYQLNFMHSTSIFEVQERKTQFPSVVLQREVDPRLAQASLASAEAEQPETALAREIARLEEVERLAGRRYMVYRIVENDILRIRRLYNMYNQVNAHQHVAAHRR